jgi:hypothetical protein
MKRRDARQYETHFVQPEYVSIRQHTSAYVSIRHHTSAYVSICQHMSAYFSMRQHMSAYVNIRQHTSDARDCEPEPLQPVGLLRQYLYFCTSKASKLA